MPIEKGSEWGRAGLLPDGAPRLQTDAEVAAAIGTHDVVELIAGDLARTLGVRQHAGTTRQHDHRDDDAVRQLLPVDAIRVQLDDNDERLCAAHVVVGSLLTGRGGIAIMNAAFIGRRNVAPRAHPGDGKLDIATFDLDPIDRVKAWRRMPTGSHVPHPGISIRRRDHDEIDLGRTHKVHIDGQSVGSARHLSLTVISSAITVAV